MSGPFGQKFREIEQKNGWMSLYLQIHMESSTEDAKLTTNIAHLPQNIPLNRYSNVLPYDHTVVSLSNGAYINASQLNLTAIGRNFIIAQSPTDLTAPQFWQMIFEHKVSCIVMLNRIIENNHIKCSMYFPGGEYGLNAVQGSPSVCFGDFQVDLKSEVHTNVYSTRMFSMTNKKLHISREIVHYQFNCWPDYCVPERTELFLEFLLDIRRHDHLNCTKYGPVVLHCSAGVGRSGTFVVIDTALLIYQKTKDLASIDLKQIIVEYRRLRMKLVQTPVQLRFAWKSILDVIEEERWKRLLTTTCIESDFVEAKEAT